MYNAYIFRNQNRKCFLTKMEVIKDGPIERLINGIFIKYNETDISIILYFEKEVQDTAIDIVILEINDPHLDIENIELNGGILDLSKDEKKFTELFLTKVDKNNQVKIKFKTIDDFYYEIGCIFYMICEGYPEYYFLNKELDQW